MHDQMLGRETSAHAARLSAAGSFLRSGAFTRGAIIALGILLCLLVYVATVTPRRYALYLGMVPNQTIAAHRDVVDEVQTQFHRDEAAREVTPVYHFREGVTEQVLEQLSSAYEQMAAVRQYARALPNFGPARAYTQEEFTRARDIFTLVPLQDFQLTTLMNAQDEQFEQMFSDLTPALRNAMQSSVTQGQEALSINAVMQVAGFRTGVSLLQNVVQPTLRAIIRPNMTVDEEATEVARQAARDAVEPVVYKQGQNIVVRGEGRVNESQMAMLSSLGLLSDNSVDYAMYAGSAVLVAAILALMTVSLRFSVSKIFFNVKRLPLIYLTAVLTLVLTYAAKALAIPYIAPLALPYLLLTVTVGILPAVTTGTAVSLIGSLMLINSGGTGGDMVNLVVVSLFSGLLGAHLLTKRYQRSFLLVAGSAVSLSSFLILLSIGMMSSLSLTQTVDRALWGFAGGTVSTLLTIALEPAMEALFNLPTPMRLLDLTNPNHPLLRRLLLETPGTYHHSIIIANLAEASAEAIGANPLLARAGAYFHDVGKLKRPLYFKENQIGTSNLHDTTDPQVSAAIIISHVREGIALAKSHRLPEEIQEIIARHHGNSVVQYFYHKASQEEGAPADEKEYRYDGGLPRTAECAIIMICDTVEAAIRTLNNPTRDEIADFIGKLVRQKMDAGLLDESPLTLKDLQIIRDTCAKVIYGVFHERIEYPKASAKAAPVERLAAAWQGLRKPTRVPDAEKRETQQKDSRST